MLKYKRFQGLAVAMALPIGACSTLITSAEDQVAVVTPGVTGAKCELFGDGQEQVYPVVTPGSVVIPRSKHPITVACEKPDAGKGVTVASPDFELWTLGNIAIGGLVGVGVDWATGAINDYPDRVEVRLIAQGNASLNGTLGQSDSQMVASASPVGNADMTFAFSGDASMAAAPPEPDLNAPIPAPLKPTTNTKKNWVAGSSGKSSATVAAPPPPPSDGLFGEVISSASATPPPPAIPTAPSSAI